MKTKTWTDEQNAAISHPSCGDKSALISAAAGSGKTAVLVERVIRLLTAQENPVDAARIVLVTFTRKAAFEMKERLEKALRSQPETPTIRRQLIRLEEAQITTINAFCLKLLKENAMLAELDSGFRVADDGELELLSKKAMLSVLEFFYELDRDEVVKTLEFFSTAGRLKGEKTTGGDSALRKAIRDLHKFTRNLPDFEEWLNEQEWLYNNPDEYYKKIVPLYERSIRDDINKAIAVIAESMSTAAYENTHKYLRAERAFFEEHLDDLSCNATFPGRRTPDKKEADDVKELLEENRAKTAKVKKDVMAAVGLISAFKKAVSDLCPIVKTLIKLSRVYSEYFGEIKRAERVVDFPDSEQLCLKLLQSNKSVLRRIQNSYDIIIVDEFQDSNFLQYEIFRLLDSGRGRLFLVGDIKQSIYRFRGADSAVFNAVSEDPEYKVMYLSRNFRSSNQVIESVNNIFENIMPDYDDNARLKPERKLDSKSYQTEVCLLNEADFPDIDGITAEAEYTARRIKQMMSEGFEVFDRKCEWGDFAVLSSAGEKNFTVYEKVFREHSIPCVSAGGGGYLKTEEIGLALDLLTVINNPYNDLSLFNIMMSPLYGFNAEEIAVCKIGKKTIPLYSAVLQYRGKAIPKRKAFLNSITRYRRIADISSASELIAALNADGAFLPLMNAAHKKANIRLLTYYAEAFAAANNDSGLPAFLAYIKELKNTDTDIKQANANSRNADCVRLMTIHGAKGLEFPVCFIARVNQEFNFRGEQNSGLFKFSQIAGITANSFDGSEADGSLCRFKTLHHDYEARHARELTVQEEMRKLYVAATRAECKLIFTGFVKNEKHCENSYLGQLTVDSGQLTVDSGQLTVDNGQLTVDSGQLTVGGQLTDEMIENIKAVYPRVVLGTIPRKVTATQVGVARPLQAKAEYDEPSIFPRNPSFHGFRRLTGKKRGDAYHKAMELIDFSKGDYIGQLKSFEKRFTSIEYNAINHADINRFFMSKLGQRAVKSKKLVKEYKLYTEIELTDVYPDYKGASFPDKPFVQGIADMFFYEDGEIVLVDYKTNRNSSPEKLSNEYKGQLSVYKKAIEEMTGVRVKECLLYSFELGEIALYI
ncbi:MAG: UvrD-helicase domain-containing protein [Oscillospiraceae bacterium]|nr:UvrD-helicase domain-containing protein [Oscillospiraceae bacterium]